MKSHKKSLALVCQINNKELPSLELYFGKTDAEKE